MQTRQDAKLVFYSLVPEALRGAAELLCALAGITSREAQPGTRPAHSRARGSAATFAKIL